MRRILLSFSILVAAFVATPVFAQTAAFDAQCVSITAPEAITPLKSFQAKVVLKNTGTKAWPAYITYLDSQTPALNVKWFIARLLLMKSVPVGGTTEFTIGAISPATNGIHAFNWQLNQANKYFGAICGKMIKVGPAADLAVTQNSTVSTVERGTDVSYAVTVKNMLATATQKVVLSQTVPMGLQLVPAQGQSCVQTGDTVRCQLGTLAGKAASSVALKFSTASATCPSSFISTATVSSDLHVDTKMQNNSMTSASTSLTCPPPPPPVIETELFVTEKSIGSLMSAVKNQKDITLAAFELRSNNEKLVVEQLAFRAAQGELMNATKYALWMDSDNDNIVDTIAQSNVAPVNGKVTFSNGQLINAGATIRYEVHADVVSSPVSNLLQLGIVTDASDLVASRFTDASLLAGIKVNTFCATTCEIAVATTAAPVWKIVSQGDLFVTKSPTPVRSRQLLGGTLENEILRLDLRAENESIDVVSLVLTAYGSGASTAHNNISRLELFKVGETTPFAVATVAGCGTTTVPVHSMCATLQNQELVVPQGQIVSILIRPRIKTDTDGAVSGQFAQFKLEGAVSATARGLSSQSNLSQNDGDNQNEGEIFIGVSAPAASQPIFGTPNVIVLSKITSIANADPNANGTAIPMGTARPIGQFKFTAATANNIYNGSNKAMFDGLIFNVNATNIDLDGSSFKVFNKADPTMTSTCAVSQTSGSSALVVTCNNMSSFIDSQIDPGSDMTLVLRADVQNAKVNSANTSTLQTSLQNFTNMSATPFSPVGSHVKFFDKDAASFVQFLWIEYPDTSVNSTSYSE